MEKQQYILKPSLKQMALRNVVIMLWNQADILTLIRKFRCWSLTCCDVGELSKALVTKVKEKVPVLLLPKSLREELMHVISPVSSEILRWQISQRLLVSDTINVDQLCWTCQGTLDYRETMKRIIRQKRVDIVDRYRLSCLYCFDDDIRTIWRKLSEDCKKGFYRENVSFSDLEEEELVIFWTYFLNRDADTSDFFFDLQNDKPERSLFQCAFASAALNGNNVATEYFFQKLTFEEKEVSLMETAEYLLRGHYACTHDFLPSDFPPQNYITVMIYLLSQMKVEEQMELFKKQSKNVLHCFMEWPWQDLFMKVAGLMWSFLSVDEYESVLHKMCISRGIFAFNRMKLFEEFFLQAPSHCRIGILGDRLKCEHLIINIFHTNDTECIKLVLRNVDDAEKEIFITTRFGLHICRELIKEEKWFLLELFVVECTLSNETKIRLKVCFLKFIKNFSREDGIEYRNCEWEKFFQLIDNAKIRVCNKRSVEESEREEQLPNKSIKANAKQII